MLKGAVGVVRGGVLDDADGGSLLGRYETSYKKNKAKDDEEKDLQVTCLECLFLHEIRRLRLIVVSTILIAGTSRCEEEGGAVQASQGGAGQASRQAL